MSDPVTPLPDFIERVVKIYGCQPTKTALFSYGKVKISFEYRYV
jgi:hypothetical protein